MQQLVNATGHIGIIMTDDIANRMLLII